MRGARFAIWVLVIMVVGELVRDLRVEIACEAA